MYSHLHVPTDSSTLKVSRQTSSPLISIPIDLPITLLNLPVIPVLPIIPIVLPSNDVIPTTNTNRPFWASTPCIAGLPSLSSAAPPLHTHIVSLCFFVLFLLLHLFPLFFSQTTWTLLKMDHNGVSQILISQQCPGRALGPLLSNLSTLTLTIPLPLSPPPPMLDFHPGERTSKIWPQTRTYSRLCCREILQRPHSRHAA